MNQLSSQPPSPEELFLPSPKARAKGVVSNKSDEELYAILFTVDGQGAVVKRAAFDLMVERLISRRLTELALLGVIQHGPESDCAD